LLRTNCKAGKRQYSYIPLLNTTYSVFYIEISLLIGSSANFAGDGPMTRTNSLELNGLVISKIRLRYYVVQINANVLTMKFPNTVISIGDEVIKINDVYCEHIGNITKLIETKKIRSIMIRKGFGANTFTVTIHDITMVNEPLENGKCTKYSINKFQTKLTNVVKRIPTTSKVMREALTTEFKMIQTIRLLQVKSDHDLQVRFIVQH